MQIPKYILEINENKSPVLVSEQFVELDSGKITEAVMAVEIGEKFYNLSKMGEEHIIILGLLSGNLMSTFRLSHGTYNMAYTSPRELFIRLLLSGCGEFILLHNHPSGSIEASKEDMFTCNRVNMAAEIMGIKMLDFIIVASGGESVLFI